MIIITNDTSTLNGALQELGETMASNLTSQGVTASASDGLTTLAGKVLDIPSGATVLYEDDATTDKTSNYNPVNMTLTYDSTNQEYHIKQTDPNDGFQYTQITNLTVPRNIKISMDFKLLTTNTMNIQPFLRVGNALLRLIYPQGSFTEFRIDTVDNSRNLGGADVNPSLNTYYTFQWIILEKYSVAQLISNSSVIASFTADTSSYISSTSNDVYLGLGWNTNSECAIKNIKITEL